MISSAVLLGFGFGNLAMLGWLAAAAVPLIVHLWNKRKYREVPWAAMQYLLAAVRKNSRRVRLEQWLLLAVRTLIILLLVTALAEPFLERAGLRFMPGERAHKVLVIDGSLSMGYQPTDKSRFDRAKELAVQIVEESTQGDGFTLVLMSQPPRVVVGTPAFEPNDFIEEIDNLKLTHTGADLPATLKQVDEILTRAGREHPRLVRRDVYFLTDLQRATWSPDLGGSEAVGDFAERSRRLGNTAGLMVIDLGQSGSDNLVVADLRTTEPFATVARDVTLEAEIRNFGRQARTHQLVELYVNGRRAGEEHVDLEPGGQRTVGFSYRFDSGGDQVVEVRLGGDLLSIDNHRWLSLPVKETIRVLCVNGKPAGGSFQGATDYLVHALAPQRDNQRAIVRPEVVSESALLERDLDRYDCIFLANVGQFTSSEAQVLEAYLRHGGGLVFFLGDQVQAESYNRQLGGEGSSVRVLPAQLLDVVDEAQYRFDPLNYQHPLVGIFRGQEGSGLLTTPVSRYFRLHVPEQTQAKVALAFSNGDPVIVEEPIERGRSILVATSADVSWTTMPMWASYVPIVQELLAMAVSGQLEQRNLEVGHPLGTSLRTLAADTPLTIHRPTGESEPARLTVTGDTSHWLLADTMQSGIYSADYGPPISRRDTFAVNVDPQQGDLAKLEADELRDQVWSGVNFVHRTTWQDLDQEPTTEISRRGGLHRWLLFGVLGLLFAETFLAWQFGHHKR